MEHFYSIVGQGVTTAIATLLVIWSSRLTAIPKRLRDLKLEIKAHRRSVTRGLTAIERRLNCIKHRTEKTAKAVAAIEGTLDRKRRVRGH